MDDDGGFDIEVGDEEEEDLDNEDVIEVVQEFWEDQAERHRPRLRAVPDERISPVPTDDGDGPELCGEQIGPRTCAMNAFAAPCPEGLTVAWDPELIDETHHRPVRRGRPGRRLRPRVRPRDPVPVRDPRHTGQGFGDPPSVLTENQADCFAGAWVAEQVEEGSAPSPTPGRWTTPSAP